MKRLLGLGLGLLLLVPSLLWLTALRKSAPPAERLGYRPSFEVTFFSSLEYRHLVSQLLAYDAIFYYGSLVDRPKERPDYQAIAKYVDISTRLNPYNIDAYYFGQAILTWDAGMVKDVNILLKRGIKRRDWDFYLPFFLGFNYSYFLHDYKSAAPYMERAARLNPRSTLLPTLVGRLYYEADQTAQAVAYLKVVYEGSGNDALRRRILVRITALETIQLLEDAVKRFTKQRGHAPEDLSELVSAHILKAIPPDPYGGAFYLDRHDGRVKTTSKLAF